MAEKECAFTSRTRSQFGVESPTAGDITFAVSINWLDVNLAMEGLEIVFLVLITITFGLEHSSVDLDWVTIIAVAPGAVGHSLASSESLRFDGSARIIVLLVVQRITVAANEISFIEEASATVVEDVA